MRANWRDENILPPEDERLCVVHSVKGLKHLARFIDGDWVDEYELTVINMLYWMPIPLLPNE
jgi:hypothetical protein